jgi:hypothetical protein
MYCRNLSLSSISDVRSRATAMAVFLSPADGAYWDSYDHLGGLGIDAIDENINVVDCGGSRSQGCMMAVDQKRSRRPHKSADGTAGQYL